MPYDQSSAARDPAIDQKLHRQSVGDDTGQRDRFAQCVAEDLFLKQPLLVTLSRDLAVRVCSVVRLRAGN
ncbi:MAG: hypothetical protein WB611_10345 [Stellaceae bacterium]